MGAARFLAGSRLIDLTKSGWVFGEPFFPPGTAHETQINPYRLVNSCIAGVGMLEFH